MCEGDKFVSVIIPTYHDWDRLKFCLDALRKQTYSSNNFEVIIVNNDPDDISPDLDLPENFILIKESKPGSYAARNAGISASRGEILAFTDSDCIPDEEWIEHSVSALEQGTSRVAGRIALFYADKRLSLGEIYEKVFSFQQDRCVSKFDFGATANMIAYRSAFHCAGLFDETIFSCGDLEWGQRAGSCGFDIHYCDNAIVYHPARRNLIQIMNKGRRLIGGKYLRTDNRFKFFVKNFVLHLLPPVVVGREVFSCDRFSFYEKVVALSVFYCIKLAKNIEITLLAFSIKKPVRE